MKKDTLPVARRTGVVANEAITRARELQQDQTDQDQSDEHVGVQQAADAEDRDPFDDQQGGQDRGYRAGENLVALDAAKA